MNDDNSSYCTDKDDFYNYNNPIDLMTGERLPLGRYQPLDPEPISKYQYKYRKYDANTNTDSDDYILAQYDVIYKDEHDIINGGATHIVRWSIYHLNDISEDEKHITPVDKFHKMLFLEGWKQVAHETVIMR